MMLHSHLSIAAACAAVVLLAGCGDDSGSSQVGQELEAGERRVMPSELEQGAAVDVEVTGPGALPTSFPADIPPYPDAEVTVGMVVPGQPTVVQFSSADAPDKILAFYRGELEKAGWTVSGDQQRLEAKKGGRTASVMVRVSEGTSEIGIMVIGG